MGNKVQSCSKQYIQNRTNWCWTVACRMVGEQFKRNNPDLNFHILYGRKDDVRTVTEAEYKNGVKTNNQEGLRMNVVKWDGDVFLVDLWQRAIVMNANTECPGDDGNWPGDDEAKERGIKYVVTGQCDSNLIQTATIGEYDSVESLPCRYPEQIRSVFQRNGYMIGNSILYPKCICHSFVLMDWTADDKILLYDPWNGMFGFYPSEDVFCRGISSPLGTGIVKWAQYIIEG